MIDDALRQLLERHPNPRPWRDGHKIPWDDPDFSQRVLAVHLDPTTHMASRAPEVIAEHLAWLQELLSAEPLPDNRPRHLLDLGCGPGLYAAPLVRSGLRYTGIDFSPAAVEHARQDAAASGLADATFHQADLTTLPADLTAALAPVDVATFWFGEFNSFPPDQARALLATVASLLVEDGLLVLEYQPWDLFPHDSSTTWSAHERSVFSDEPHLWLQEHHWDEEASAEIHVFWILEAVTGRLQRHTQCHQAYTDETLVAMLADAGFTAPEFHDPVTGVDERFEFPLVVARRRS
jgi:SAM-dependent methyltransferase